MFELDVVLCGLIEFIRAGISEEMVPFQFFFIDLGLHSLPIDKSDDAPQSLYLLSISFMHLLVYFNLLLHPFLL